MKYILVNVIKDSVVDLLYYDRKEDEDLPVGAIEEMIEGGILSIDEMVEIYKNELTKQLVE